MCAVGDGARRAATAGCVSEGASASREDDNNKHVRVRTVVVAMKAFPLCFLETILVSKFTLTVSIFSSSLLASLTLLKSQDLVF